MKQTDNLTLGKCETLIIRTGVIKNWSEHRHPHKENQKDGRGCKSGSKTKLSKRLKKDKHDPQKSKYFKENCSLVHIPPAPSPPLFFFLPLPLLISSKQSPNVEDEISNISVNKIKYKGTQCKIQ